MKNISKKIWNRIITSGLKGIVAGICFVAVLSVSVYFASAHLSKPISTQNKLESSQEAINNEQNNAQINTEQNNDSSSIAPEATVVKTESPKVNSALTSSQSCSEEQKAQALKDEEANYNASVANENKREQKALDDLNVARSERVAQIRAEIQPEIDALTKEQSQKLTDLYRQKNLELARLPHDSEGRILNYDDQLSQINAKYDSLIKAVNDEYLGKRKVADQQRIEDLYKQYQITATEIVKESKMKLAELASTHQAKIDQINNTCY